MLQGSQEVLFRPQSLPRGGTYQWDIGSAGSTTMLGLAVLPFASSPARVELCEASSRIVRSLSFLQHVVVPMLNRMGVVVTAEMTRPGYVPRGEGILRLTVEPARRPLRSLQLIKAGPVERIWGIALASHLAERKVAQRMADSVEEVLAEAGHQPAIQLVEDTTAQQPGAVLALFADLYGGVRLGADRAGAFRRSAERIGHSAAR